MVQFLNRARWMAAAALLLPVQAVAQTAPVYGDPAAMLPSNLRILAQNPYDLNALRQAGLGAIAVGDPNAAIGFLARAEELAPRDGSIKAALGTALTMVEKPADALRLFADAALLGHDERLFARDRGLAYDLMGDTKNAQKDYATALKRDPSDDETIRRLALSLGIAGDKDGALEKLAPLLRRSDQAAWRARSFVLAMNGDLTEAERIANAAAPDSMAGALTPFLRRLPLLTREQRAHAVHFGTMPSDGSQLAAVDTSATFRSVPTSMAAPAAVAKTPAVAPTVAKPLDPREVRRREREAARLAKLAERGRKAAAVRVASNTAAPMPAPAASPSRADAQRRETEPAAPPVLGQRVGTRIGPVDPERLPPEVRAVARREGTVTVVQGATSLPPPDALSARIAAQTRPAPDPAPPPASTPPEVKPAQVAVADMAPGFSLSPAAVPAGPPAEALPPADPPPAPGFEVAPEPQPTQIAAASAPASAPPAEPSPPSPSPATEAPASPQPRELASIIATLNVEAETAAVALPSDAELKARRIAAQKKADAEAKARAEKAAEDEKKARELAEAKRNPARVWVQIASGANRAGLPGTWRKLKDQAPKALEGQSPASVAYKATNRLLVGPFKSASEARALINRLGREGINATPFTSEAGQEIAKLGTR